MIQISALIVEDEVESREIIKSGIQRYNAKKTEIDFSVVKEASSFKSASAIIENEEIALVFLDLTLIGPKSGIDLIGKFPYLSYIIVSGDEHAADKVLNNTSHAHLHSFRYKTAGIPDIEKIVTSIEKFVYDKNLKGGFYSWGLNHGRTEFRWKNIAIISKRPLEISEKRQITECMKCPYPEKDRTFFCRNVVNTIEPHHLCLFNYSIRSGFAISSVIGKARLNPKQFIIISPSLILNLDYVKHLDRQEFYLEIIEGSRIYNATITGDKAYFLLSKESLIEQGLL